MGGGLVVVWVELGSDGFFNLGFLREDLERDLMFRCSDVQMFYDFYRVNGLQDSGLGW